MKTKSWEIGNSVEARVQMILVVGLFDEYANKDEVFKDWITFIERGGDLEIDQKKMTLSFLNLLMKLFWKKKQHQIQNNRSTE